MKKMSCIDVIGLFGAHIHQDFFVTFPDWSVGVNFVLSNFSDFELTKLEQCFRELSSDSVPVSEKSRM